MKNMQNKGRDGQISIYKCLCCSHYHVFYKQSRVFSETQFKNFRSFLKAFEIVLNYQKLIKVWQPQ